MSKRFEGYEEFVQVIESGSFSAAAKHLGVAKSHVSQQVSRLEDRLGVRLLHRTTRKLSLTDIGLQYLQHCRQMLEDADAADRAVMHLQQQVSGRLRINAPYLLGEVLLVPAIAAFMKQHPKLEIELDLNSHKVDLIDNNYDLAIQVGRRADSNVVNRVVATSRFYVVASPGYLARHNTPMSPQELKHHHCLLATYGAGKTWQLQGPDGLVEAQIHSQWRSNSGHALRAAALQGLGLAYLPDYYLKDDLASQRLAIALKHWSSSDREIVAIYQDKRHLSAKIRLFVEFISEHFYTELKAFA
jgi:DNA-binding transcriptional LysR family regulator